MKLTNLSFILLSLCLGLYQNCGSLETEKLNSQITPSTPEDFNSDEIDTEAPLLSELLFFEASYPAPRININEIKNESDGISLDPQGNLIVGGVFSQSRIFGGKTLTVQGGSTDAFLAKFNSSGELLWAFEISSPNNNGDENIFDLTTDSLGNIYINGGFTETLKLGSYEFTSFGAADQFLAKVSPSGEVIWAKQMGSSLNDGGNEVSMMNDDFLIVSAMSEGQFAYTNSNGQKTTYTSSGKDGYLLKVDSRNGDVVLSRQVGGSGDSQIRAIGSDKNGQMLIGLEFSGTVTFGDLSITARASGANGFRTDTDGALLYLDSQGELIWHKTISSPGFDNFRGASTDKYGNVYATGVHSTNARLENLTLAADKISDQFVVKYDSQGDLLWYRRWGGKDAIATQVGAELEASEDGLVFVTGAFRNNLTLFDENNNLIESVFSLTHPRDVASYVTLSPKGKVVNANYIVGTAHPTDTRRGDVASSVIAIQKINGINYVATGAVLHGTGLVSNSDSNQEISTSDVTREFSVALRKLEPKND